MKSLIVALLLLAVTNVWLWRHTAGCRGRRAALLTADAALLAVAWFLGGDAVLAVLGTVFLVVLIRVIVRELRDDDHAEALNPDRIQRFRSGR